MKVKTQLLVLSSVLLLGAQATAYAGSTESPFPAAAEDYSFNLPAIESYAERHARMGEPEAWGVSKREAVQGLGFPADAEESYNLPAIESRAERYARMGEESEAWGVSKRKTVEPHDPFPFGGGPVDG